MKYACIAQHQQQPAPGGGAALSVRLLCQLLGVSPSGYYTAQQRQRQPLSARAPRVRANAALTTAIRAIHAASQGRYGAPKVHRELVAHGQRCGRHRVARLMRRAALQGVCRRRFRTTTQSQHAYPPAPDLVQRRFAPSAVRERDRVWVADITYLPTREGWLYLAVVMDLASRRVLGWCADRHLDQSLALRALAQALVLRRPAAGVIHHSDRGVHYAATAYRAQLAAHGLVSSMGRTGDCWDNAVAESFFATLKTELVHHAHWSTRAEAQRAVAGFINIWYNHQRRHASLGYQSPVQYERELARCRTA